jgi:acetyl-CoA acetyltransferase
VAVKNHHYGALNPNALFRKEITMEKALASEAVASPLQVYDCCANADGAACVILAEEGRAREVAEKPVWLDGMACATASMSVLRRENLTGLPSAQKAAADAYAMAGVTAADIKVADVHDCFTVAEIMAYEDLGFCPKGQGGPFVADRQTYIGGTVAVNVDGGLKAKGHPIGATGVSMTYEIAKQLRGEAEDRQVPDADVGLTHNVGGIRAVLFRPGAKEGLSNVQVVRFGQFLAVHQGGRLCPAPEGRPPHGLPLQKVRRDVLSASR